MTTATASFADHVAPPLNVTIGYGEVLAKDIPAEHFAHMPKPMLNHPAFCYGHLAFYANRVLKTIGREDLQKPFAREDELFADGVECVEQDGRYPDKDTIMAWYRDRYQVLADALRSCDDAVFARENPAEGRFKEMCPTVGCVAVFLSNSHHMMHLGQVSAWRRVMGLGSAM